MNVTTACRHCGFANPPGARFCARCGKPQQQACPECGAEVVPGAKFCANCGIPLTAPATPADAPVLTAEARKVVTILFADLVGSTGLTERLDPEEARQVVGKFYDVVQHVVERWFAGTIANLLGDAVLAVFGLPATHEDDPERAVRAGLAIRDAMPVLNGHLASTHGVHLAVRVGINTGEVVAASGSTFDRDFLVSDAVTTAARLQQSVPAGTVVVGERTYRLTRDAVEYRELPPLEVKGKDVPLKVWAALAPLPERADVRRATAPLVGRHAELGLLRHLYQRCRDEGRVHLVTIFGQPGVGKSRLLREFLAEVRDLTPPSLVLRGRSVAYGQIGYHALLDILRFQAGLLDTDPPDAVRAKVQTWLTDLLPDRTDLLEGLLLTFGAPGAPDPEQTRQRLFESWQQLVASLAAQRSVILAFEDLHWADAGVLDLIDMLVDRITSASLLIIGLVRPDLLERRPTWGGGRRNATALELAPLRQDEAEQLVTALSNEGLRPDVIKLIAQRAGGNPLFAEELVRMMLESSTPGAAIPDTIQAVLAARIDRLPPAERRALQAAAVIGRSFWTSAVGLIAGLVADDASSALTGLVAKDLVVGRPRSTIAGDAEFAFRHILTRDVAYGMLPRTQRQRAHAEAARWMETRLGERIEEFVEILAEHVRLAGDDARAVVYLHRAGNKARRLYANADAIRLFDQALDAAGRAGAPAEQIAAVHRDRGSVYQLQGAYAAALDDFERGLTAARQAGDHVLEAVLENLVGLVHHRLHHLEEAERHFSTAADVARAAGDRLTLGRSLVDLANIAWDRGRMGPDHQALTEGLAFLRRTDDLSGLARGLNLLCMARLGTGNGPEAIAAAEEALAAARAAGDKSREATSLSYLGHVHSYMSRFPEALQYVQSAMTLAQGIEDRRRVAYTIFFLARVRFWTGQLGETIRLLREGVESSRKVAAAQLLWQLMYLGQSYAEVGATQEGIAVLQEADGLSDPSSARWWQPRLISRAALAWLRREHDPATLIREIEEAHWSEFIPSEGEALLSVGRMMLAAGQIDALRRFVAARRPSVVRMGSTAYLAALAVLDAQLAAHGDNPAAALPLVRQATRLSRDCGSLITEWAALELHLTLQPDPQSREDLRGLLRQLADGLPEDVRLQFLASPRAALLRG